jgi:hypothetical protein
MWLMDLREPVEEDRRSPSDRRSSEVSRRHKLLSGVEKRRVHDNASKIVLVSREPRIDHAVCVSRINCYPDRSVMVAGLLCADASGD